MGAKVHTWNGKKGLRVKTLRDGENEEQLDYRRDGEGWRNRGMKEWTKSTSSSSSSSCLVSEVTPANVISIRDGVKPVKDRVLEADFHVYPNPVTPRTRPLPCIKCRLS